MGLFLNKLTEGQRSTIANAINTLASTIYGDNTIVGWWDDSSKNGGDIPDKYMVPTKIALMHSELSEALEGNRKGLMDDHLPHRTMEEVEYADAIIRILDCAAHRGLDVGAAIIEKLAYNATREDHKREVRGQQGGKSI